MRTSAGCRTLEAPSNRTRPTLRYMSTREGRSFLMQDFKKKLQDEIAALEYELRNELPREILKRGRTVI